MFGVVGRGGLDFYVGSWISMLDFYILAMLAWQWIFLPIQVLLSLVSVCNISGWVSKKIPLGCRKGCALGMPKKGVPLGCQKRVCPMGAGKKMCTPTKNALELRKFVSSPYDKKAVLEYSRMRVSKCSGIRVPLTLPGGGEGPRWWVVPEPARDIFENASKCCGISVRPVKFVSSPYDKKAVLEYSRMRVSKCSGITSCMMREHAVWKGAEALLGVEKAPAGDLVPERDGNQRHTVVPEPVFCILLRETSLSKYCMYRSSCS